MSLLKNLHIKPAKEKEQTRDVPAEEEEKVRVLNPIVSEGYALSKMTPTETISITENGENINVARYAKANVNVPNPSTGTLSITDNGTYDVTQYASASVEVDSYDWVVEEQTVTIPADVTEETLPSIIVDNSELSNEDMVVLKVSGTVLGQSVTGYVNAKYTTTENGAYMSCMVDNTIFNINSSDNFVSWHFYVSLNDEYVPGTYTVSAIKGF